MIWGLGFSLKNLISDSMLIILLNANNVFFLLLYKEKPNVYLEIVNSQSNWKIMAM